MRPHPPREPGPGLQKPQLMEGSHPLPQETPHSGPHRVSDIVGTGSARGRQCGVPSRGSIRGRGDDGRALADGQPAAANARQPEPPISLGPTGDDSTMNALEEPGVPIRAL